MSKTISICCEGDSLSYVVGGMFWRAVNGGNAITYAGGTTQARTELRAAYGSHLVANFSLSGRTIAAVTSNASVVDALLNTSPRPVAGRVTRDFILCLSIGVNDFGVSGATLASSVSAYCLARRAAGWRIILCTLTSRSDASGATFDSVTQGPFNTIIKGSGWAAANGVDLICDIASNPELGSSGASSNPTYSAYWSGDAVHPSATGYTLAAVTYKAAIDSLIATRMTGF